MDGLRMRKSAAFQLQLGLVLFWLCQFHSGLCLLINRLSIPQAVQNGSVDSVILDCDYVLSSTDGRLVVKWFLNDDPEPVYQWIPELGTRHTSWRLQGRLNMDYSVTPPNRYTRYRALNILRPTTDLSGRYSCHVVSLSGQDSEEETMIVYEPPRSLYFNYTKSSSDRAVLMCEAEHVFPLPEIKLYVINPDSGDREELSDYETTVSEGVNDAYNVEVSRTVLDKDLLPGFPTFFDCVLRIPGTDFEEQRRITYYPDGGLTDGSPLISHASSLLTLFLCTVLWGQW